MLMGELKDLLNRDVSELSDEELMKRVRLLQSSRIVKESKLADSGKKRKRVISNSDKQLADMVSNANDAQRELLKKLLGGK